LACSKLHRLTQKDPNFNIICCMFSLDVMYLNLSLDFSRHCNSEDPQTSRMFVKKRSRFRVLIFIIVVAIVVIFWYEPVHCKYIVIGGICQYCCFHYNLISLWESWLDDILHPSTQDLTYFWK
jgi:hypothetical protein